MKENLVEQINKLPTEKDKDDLYILLNEQGTK